MANTRAQRGLDLAPPTPANPLERAARIIERRGWCQNRFVDGRGAVCLDFALLLSDLEVNEAVRRVVESELRRRGGPKSVVRWNDHPGRSQVEVVGLLRAVSRDWPTAGRRRRRRARRQ
jgi:hypothetical protein